MNRKRAHVGVFLAMLVVVSSMSFVAATAQCFPAASADWPSHRADPGRTGATTYSGPAPYATEDWNAIFGARGESVPAVANGTAYVTVREWKSVYSDESELYALESSDEKPPRDHQVAQDEPEDPRVTIETAPKDTENRTFEGNQTIVLRANASTAENDEILRHEWDADGADKLEGSGEKITVSTDFYSERTVIVRVVDDDRLSGEDSMTLTRG